MSTTNKFRPKIAAQYCVLVLVTILVMIGLSSAFETIDHSILFSRLELRYGITSVVLEWFTSYYLSLRQYNEECSKVIGQNRIIICIKYYYSN